MFDSADVLSILPSASGRWYCLWQTCILRRQLRLGCPIYQQMATAACASGGTVPMYWELRVLVTDKLRQVYTGACLLLLSTPMEEG